MGRKHMMGVLCMLLLILALAGCSNNQSSSRDSIVKPSNDKIIVTLKGCVDERDTSDVCLMSSVEFKVLNISKKPLDFDGLVLVAYDENGNMVEVTGDNESVTLKPKEKSKTFKYFLEDYARMVIITGYKYSENNTVYMDNLFGTEIVMGSDE